ncbi:hypothetical protein KUCAC02_010793, partial [Chaenocephalus aceratus]
GSIFEERQSTLNPSDPREASSSSGPRLPINPISFHWLRQPTNQSAVSLHMTADSVARSDTEQICAGASAVTHTHTSPMLGKPGEDQEGAPNITAPSAAPHHLSCGVKTATKRGPLLKTKGVNSRLQPQQPSCPFVC